MPLYEYQCTACGHRFEVIQKFSDEPVEKCPKCGKRVERLVSSPAIQFKGTGWYVTDYAKRGAPTDGKEAATPGKEPAKETTSPAPEKPAAAKESGGTSPTSSTTK